MKKRKGDWSQTYTGKQFWPLDPRPEEIDIFDIAHGLSLLCRFTGQCKWFYSVAQHSMYMSIWCEPEIALYCLLDDAPEAYMGDMPAPIKRLPLMKPYCKAEHRLQMMIFECFGLKPERPKAVEIADKRMLLTEKRYLMGKEPADWNVDAEPYDEYISPRPLMPEEAEQMFLMRFNELYKG